MTVTSIIKTIVQLYCSSIFFNTTVPEPLLAEREIDQSNTFPVLLAQHTKVNPTAPPQDRGSGR